MKRPKILNFIADLWRLAVIVTIGVSLYAVLLLTNIQSSLPGLSESEAAFRASAESLTDISNNPLYAFNKLGSILFSKLGFFNEITPRITSALIGLIAVSSFYMILRMWHTRRVALFATLLFGSSSWLLAIARLGDANSAHLLILPLLLGGIWLQQKMHLAAASLLTVISGIFLLYSPAMIIFVAPILIWQRSRLVSTFKQLKTLWQILSVLLIVIGLIPLIWSLIQNPEHIKTWLGIPDTWPSLVDYLKNLVYVPLSIFLTNKLSFDYGLGSLPLIDAFTTTMVGFGAYAYAFRLKLDRTKLILAALVLGCFIVALNGPVTIAVLLPFIYILSAAGISLLLQNWFTVFPRNPLARGIAIVLMSAAVGVTCFYHLNRYYTAWPNTPATKTTFQIPY